MWFQEVLLLVARALFVKTKKEELEEDVSSFCHFVLTYILNTSTQVAEFLFASLKTVASKSIIYILFVFLKPAKTQNFLFIQHFSLICLTCIFFTLISSFYCQLKKTFFIQINYCILKKNCFINFVNYFLSCCHELIVNARQHVTTSISLGTKTCSTQTFANT